MYFPLKYDLLQDTYRVLTILYVVRICNIKNKNYTVNKIKLRDYEIFL